MLDDELHLGELAASAREDNVGVDDAYALFLDWNRRRGTNLWPHQDDAFLALALGDHVILGTPTGSGKSTVALWLAFLALCTGKRMYYTAPIKALVSEKFFDLVELFGRENVGMITGDVTLNPDAPIICCTAEILANQALREGEAADVGAAYPSLFSHTWESLPQHAAPRFPTRGKTGRGVLRLPVPRNA